MLLPVLCVRVCGRETEEEFVCLCATFEGINVNNEAWQRLFCLFLFVCVRLCARTHARTLSAAACVLHIPRQEFGTAGNWQIPHAHEWVKKVQPFISEDCNLMGRMLTRGSGRSDGDTHQ